MEKPAETYWEKRCSITEQTLNHVINVLGNALPEVQPPLQTIIELWGEAIDDIEVEDK